MINKTKSIKIALIGTALVAFGAMTSCCGSSPDPVSPPSPVIMEPVK